MTASEYSDARRLLGTQKAVAALLGVDLRTVQRREAGEIAVTREAELALLALAENRSP